MKQRIAVATVVLGTALAGWAVAQSVNATGGVLRSLSVDTDSEGSVEVGAIRVEWVGTDAASREAMNPNLGLVHVGFFEPLSAPVPQSSSSVWIVY